MTEPSTSGELFAFWEANCAQETLDILVRTSGSGGRLEAHGQNDPVVPKPGLRRNHSRTKRSALSSTM
jgi:hypothetical protein